MRNCKKRANVVSCHVLSACAPSSRGTSLLLQRLRWPDDVVGLGVEQVVVVHVRLHDAKVSAIRDGTLGRIEAVGVARHAEPIHWQDDATHKPADTNTNTDTVTDTDTHTDTHTHKEPRDSSRRGQQAGNHTTSAHTTSHDDIRGSLLRRELQQVTAVGTTVRRCCSSDTNRATASHVASAWLDEERGVPVVGMGRELAVCGVVHELDGLNEIEGHLFQHLVVHTQHGISRVRR